MELTTLAQQSLPPVKEAEGYSSVVALAEEHFEEGLVSWDLHVQDNLGGPDCADCSFEYKIHLLVAGNSSVSHEDPSVWGGECLGW